MKRTAFRRMMKRRLEWLLEWVPPRLWTFSLFDGEGTGCLVEMAHPEGSFCAAYRRAVAEGWEDALAHVSIASEDRNLKAARKAVAAL